MAEVFGFSKNTTPPSSQNKHNIAVCLDLLKPFSDCLFVYYPSACGPHRWLFAGLPVNTVYKIHIWYPKQQKVENI